jgi:hypothetical protein
VVWKTGCVYHERDGREERGGVVEQEGRTMRKSKRQLEIDNLLLKARIDFLEGLLCPCQQHDFVKVDYALIGGSGRGDETVIYRYECGRCGKRVKSYKLLESRCKVIEGRADNEQR